MVNYFLAGCCQSPRGKAANGSATIALMTRKRVRSQVVGGSGGDELSVRSTSDALRSWSTLDYMAYAPHAMIAFVGKWNVTAAADEVWQFGIRVTSGTPDGGHISDCQAFADAIATDVGTWFGAGTSQMQNNALL